VLFKKHSKKIIILFIIFLLVLIFTINRFGQQFEVYINWKVYLPRPDNIDTIFKYDFRKGEDFLIWSYSKNKFTKITSSKRFNEIAKDNVELVTEKIIEYYNLLDDDEKNLFDKNANIEDLLKIGNYYLLKLRKNEKSDFLLIIGNIKEDKLYYFNVNL